MSLWLTTLKRPMPPPNEITRTDSRSDLHFESRELRRGVVLIEGHEGYHGGAAVARFCRQAALRVMGSTPPAIVYRTVGADGIDAVRHLWEKLRAYHAPLLGEKPPFLFEPRKQGILRKAAAGKLRIELARVAWHADDMAYCISTVSADGCGEVDSIFVEEHYRGCGVGSELLRRALAWLDSAGASSKVVMVAQGNEGALALYRRFGFHPRTILLQQRHGDAA